MTSIYHPTRQLRKLVDLSLNDELTRVEMAQLEELLQDDNALNYYLEIAQTEANLSLFHNNPAVQKTSTAHITPLTQPTHCNQLPITHRSHKTIWLGGAAAIITLSSILVWKISLHPTPQNNEISAVQEIPPADTKPLATITNSFGAVWDEQGKPPHHTLSAADPAIILKNGIAELTYRSGTRLLIQAPAKFLVTGPDSGHLDYGRVVSQTPPRTTPFVLHYYDGNLKNPNSELAIFIPKDHSHIDVGVLNGKIQIRSPKLTSSAWITKDHAIQHHSQTPDELHSIPFNHNEFVRNTPSRELPWDASDQNFEPVALEFDISSMIWKAGDYHAVFKWMHGIDALIIRSVDILRNDTLVARDQHLGISGDSRFTKKNTYNLTIPSGAYQPGKWTLRANVQVNPRSLRQIQLPDKFLHDPNIILLEEGRRSRREHQQRILRNINSQPDSNGIILFEEGHLLTPTAKDFAGSWEYVFNGKHYTRTFFPDGTARFTEASKIKNNYDASYWTVIDGILYLFVRDPNTGSLAMTERHALRDENTLLFLNRSYRNAHKTVSFDKAQRYHASSSDFIGRWQYTYNGQIYQRVFHQDGSCQLITDGDINPAFSGATWHVSNGLLALKLKDGATEFHLLRTNGKLMFLSHMYQDAVKQP